MGITLYTDYLSQPCRAVGIFLAINKIPFNEKYVDVRARENLKPEYTALNPFHKVPAVDEDNFFLIESEAILKYIARNKDVAEHWYPTAPRQRARVDEYMAWQHTGLRQKQIAMTRAIYSQQIWKTTAPPVPSVVAETTEAVENELRKFEDYFLGDKLYLTGGDITIADIMCSQELLHVGLILFDLEEDFPKIAAYMNRVRERLNPYFDKYSEAITIFAETKLGKGKHIENKAVDKNVEAEEPASAEEIGINNLSACE